ncbi:MAG: 50S ribosome-binding GTPase, partial [Halioglobus sp.]|nr:50S ribosome-binding GTPase [Halioglobus sp.]
RVKQLYNGDDQSRSSDLSDAFFHGFTDLIDVGINEHIARQLLQSTRAQVQASGLAQDRDAIRSTLHQLVEDLLPVTGGIRLAEGKTRRVALVGPTGVGKTTTIAKLAANFRLRERRRVGLVTVDTYRVAAVEQLRTYADIIDLPMEVVSTPREMREAIARLSDLDLVLVDTAGRSPRDQIKIQELKSLLNEARADEVHLVQSCTA